jgi:hypothetical protein
MPIVGLVGGAHANVSFLLFSPRVPLRLSLSPWPDVISPIGRWSRPRLLEMIQGANKGLRTSARGEMRLLLPQHEPNRRIGKIFAGAAARATGGRTCCHFIDPLLFSQ